MENEQQYRNALNKFNTQLIELPTKILEQTAFNTRPKIERHMLIVMDESIPEEHLTQPLLSNHNHFKIEFTFFYWL